MHVVELAVSPELVSITPAERNRIHTQSATDMRPNGVYINFKGKSIVPF